MALTCPSIPNRPSLALSVRLAHPETAVLRERLAVLDSAGSLDILGCQEDPESLVELETLVLRENLESPENPVSRDHPEMTRLEELESRDLLARLDHVDPKGLLEAMACLLKILAHPDLLARLDHQDPQDLEENPDLLDLSGLQVTILL